MEKKGPFKHLTFLLVFLFIPLMFSLPEGAESRTVRVGIYKNPPKVEMGKDNKPQGIFIDIIEHIAKIEGWKLIYIEGNWDDGLRRLLNDSIDIMPDMGYSDPRSLLFDFNKITVLPSWVQVYTKKGLEIERVSDLDGKTVSVLENSIQQELLLQISKRFDISINQILSSDYKMCIEKVKSGDADAVIVDRFYGYLKEKEHSIVPSPVVLNPNSLLFASTKGRNNDLLCTIDKHLADLLNDPHSIYYRSLANWLSEKPQTFIPAFLLWSFIIISGLLVVTFTMSLLLKWQVRKRTELLDNKNRELSIALQELRKARDSAIKRERLHVLGQLASGIAHDFNNVLVPIVGYSEILLSNTRDTEEDNDLREKLTLINKAAMSGAEIVKRMQEFYHTARNSDIKTRINLNEIIHDVVKLAEPKLKGPGVNTQIKVSLSLEDDIETFGIKSDIHEMILNLVLNAADAMLKGGHLEIIAGKDGEKDFLIVKDNGTGMNKEVKENCLQPFFTTKGAKGTGIGLAMVSSTVENHNGSIEIESSPGTGTSFRITFPSSNGIITEDTNPKETDTVSSDSTC
jgi:signal transduction histidine kinase